MCSPEVALGAQILGAGQSVVGSIFGAMGQKSALKSQARMADINAKLEDGQARASLMSSEKEQATIGLRGAQTKASQMAGYAANGIDVGSQSAVNVYTSTDYVTEVDRNQAEANGIAAAWGHRINATSYRNQGLAARAKASAIDPLQAGVQSLISQGGQVAGSWYKLDSMGAFDKAPGTSADSYNLIGEGADALSAGASSGGLWGF